MRSWVGWFGWVGLVLLLSTSSQAQPDQIIEGLALDQDVDPSARILPAIPIPEEKSAEGLLAGARVVLREIRIEGSHALPSHVLAEITASYLDRSIGRAELLELRDRLTLAYSDRGFVTSGAVLPAQSLADGVAVFEIHEGSLAAIEVETDGRFRANYFRRRLERTVAGIVNINTLDARLRRFQRDRRIDRIEARLIPTDQRDQSILRLRVEEAKAFRLSAAFDNYRSPSIGAYHGEAQGAVDNVFGVGDEFSIRAGLTEGLRQVEARFAVPLTKWDTQLALHYRWSDATVVAEPIGSILDIQSRAYSTGFELRQPVYATPQLELAAFVQGEYRRSESRLDGTRFSFSIDPAEKGLTKLTAMRFGLGFTSQRHRRVIALRATASVGLDILDATRSASPFPDGRFSKWLLQGSWIERLPWLDARLRARLDAQLAQDTLFPSEQIALGGRYSVRGYRENTLVRDSGVIGSLEIDVPIYGRVTPRTRVSFVGFFEGGRAWNRERDEIGPSSIFSVGLGTRVQIGPHLTAELFWAERLRDVDRIGERDLQDSGVHLALRFDWAR